MDHEREIIGVVAAEVNSIEQRQIVKGVIAAAQRLGRKTVVLSNVYNPYEFTPELACENRIYELARSEQLMGVVMIAESFSNEDTRVTVRRVLRARKDIPVIVIGIGMESLGSPNTRFINASDEADLEDITAHLTALGACQIDLLNGPEGNAASEARERGYHRALTKASVPFAKKRVHYGDFWMPSGEALAKRYISGELPMPEAVVCANDYMAYGLLDTFLRNGVRVPGDVMVTGYEYVFERIFHSPLLTTYRRGRRELGEYAAGVICDIAEGKTPAPFSAPRGEWIPGDTVPGEQDSQALSYELSIMRAKQTFDKWNVSGTMEQELTSCDSLEDFLSVLGRHRYLIRAVSNCFLCLYENWYDTAAPEPKGTLSCVSIPEGKSVTAAQGDFFPLWRDSPEFAAHYYLPLFFGSHLFGYLVLEYSEPDAYDDIFRNWLKSVCVGLEMLCMKNDIRYLLRVQNLSERRDSFTGLYNARGFKDLLACADPIPREYLVLRAAPLESGVSPESGERAANLLLGAAKVLREVCPEGAILARVDDRTFVCAAFERAEGVPAKLTLGKIFSVLIHELDLPARGELFAYAGAVLSIPQGFLTPDIVLEAALSRADEEAAALKARLRSPHGKELFSARCRLWANPEVTVEEICRSCSFSAGYFRQIYKDCFSVSFHRDAISARIARAVYLLSTTVMNIANIAEACGWVDYNYFLRQFQNLTGLTPGQYRKKV